MSSKRMDPKELRVFFIHGYKGNFDVCSKGRYIKERVREYNGINMNLDFPGSRMQIFEFGMLVQTEELKKYKPNHHDVIIGHSFGGGALIKLMEIEDLISTDTKIILLGASIFARFPKLKLTERHKKFRNVVIVHGTSDSTIEFISSEDLHRLFGKENSKLVTVEDGTHGLTELTRKKDEDPGSFISLITSDLRDIPSVIINDEEKRKK